MSVTTLNVGKFERVSLVLRVETTIIIILYVFNIYVIANSKRRLFPYIILYTSNQNRFLPILQQCRKPVGIINKYGCLYN